MTEIATSKEDALGNERTFVHALDTSGDQTAATAASDPASPVTPTPVASLGNSNVRETLTSTANTIPGLQAFREPAPSVSSPQQEQSPPVRTLLPPSHPPRSIKAPVNGVPGAGNGVFNGSYVAFQPGLTTRQKYLIAAIGVITAGNLVFSTIQQLKINKLERTLALRSTPPHHQNAHGSGVPSLNPTASPTAEQRELPNTSILTTDHASLTAYNTNPAIPDPQPKKTPETGARNQKLTSQQLDYIKNQLASAGFVTEAHQISFDKGNFLLSYATYSGPWYIIKSGKVKRKISGDFDTQSIDVSGRFVINLTKQIISTNANGLPSEIQFKQINIIREQLELPNIFEIFTDIQKCLAAASACRPATLAP